METKILTKALLERHPVWKWNETRDARCPLPRFESFPENETTLFIKAIFKTPNGERFDGYLTGKNTFYAFALFSGSSVFHFNFNLPEIIFEQQQAMAVSLGKTDFQLFPLHYEARIFRDKPPIEGVLKLQG